MPPPPHLEILRQVGQGPYHMGLLLLPLLVILSHGDVPPPGVTPAPTDTPDARAVAQLCCPTRLDIGPDGTVCVADYRAGSVFWLDAALRPMRELPDLDTPLAVAVDSGGHLFVSSKARGEVSVRDARGRLLRRLGRGRGEFSMPNDIVVARDRRVYVVDSLEDCVKVYDERGRRIRVIGASGQGPGAFDFPSCLALSPDGSELYVGDQRNHRVQVFSLDGGWLRQFGAPLKRGRFEGCFGSIQSIATVMTASGQTLVHVLDASQNRVQILTHEGSYLTTYGQTGSMPGQFRLALDICVNRQGRILACDAGNRRIETIR